MLLSKKKINNKNKKICKTFRNCLFFVPHYLSLSFLICPCQLCPTVFFNCAYNFLKLLKLFFYYFIYFFIYFSILQYLNHHLMLSYLNTTFLKINFYALNFHIITYSNVVFILQLENSSQWFINYNTFINRLGVKETTDRKPLTVTTLVSIHIKDIRS